MRDYKQLPWHFQWKLYSVRRQQNPLHSDSWGLYIAADGALSTVRLLYRVPDGQKTVGDGHVFSGDKGKRYLLHIANHRHDKESDVEYNCDFSSISRAGPI